MSEAPGGAEKQIPTIDRQVGSDFSSFSKASQEVSSIVSGPQKTEAQANLDQTVGRYIDYLKSKTPFKFADPQELQNTPTLSKEEIKTFRAKLVDLNIIPEKTYDTRISPEDAERLKTMTPYEMSTAVNIGMANIIGKALYGDKMPEQPGGVKFVTYEVNNRTGESKPVNPQKPTMEQQS
jgi:hypothetical protein